MKRRDFLTNTASLATAVLLTGTTPLTLASRPTSYKERFDKALNDYPILKAWQGLAEDLSATKVQWQGTIPKEIVGLNMYRNGPGKKEYAGQRYSHFFDGDGFINRYELGRESLTHTGKFVRTDKFRQELEAGQFLYNASGSIINSSKRSRGPNSTNSANIALLPVQGELWALWEAGEAYRVNRKNLNTEGKVEFSSALKGLPFSAHPHIDIKGNIWNFGDISSDAQGALLIYKLNSVGQLIKSKRINIPRTTYVHDFAMTERYLVFYLPPLFMVPDANTYIDRFQWLKNKSGILVIVDKNTFSVNQIEMEAGFIYHFGNAWSQGNELFINTGWQHDASDMTDISADMVGNLTKHAKAIPLASIIRVDLTNQKATVYKSNVIMEFPQFDKKITEKKSKFTFGVSMSDPINKHNQEFDTICRLNTDSGNEEKYCFGNDCIVEEPLFVPKNNYVRESDGYLLSTYLNYKKERSGLCIFEANNIDAGPIAKAELPFYLPLGIHGTIV